jgi:hypothetical protein
MFTDVSKVLVSVLSSGSNSVRNMTDPEEGR